MIKQKARCGIGLAAAIGLLANPAQASWLGWGNPDENVVVKTIAEDPVNNYGAIYALETNVGQDAASNTSEKVVIPTNGFPNSTSSPALSMFLFSFYLFKNLSLTSVAKCLF